MAPVKFGLFRARSREQAEQPSTENLLQNSGCHDTDDQTPGSPLPSTSKGFETHSLHSDASDLQLQHLQLDSDDEETTSDQPVTSKETDSQVNYLIFKEGSSTDGTSLSTLNDDGYEHIQDVDPSNSTHTLDQVPDDASTTYDVNSIQLDGASLASLAPSEDLSVNCGPLRKGRKNERDLRELEKRRDSDMWRASDIEVMEHILNRSGSVDDQYKWEAIATARGLCTLTDCCNCRDCHRNKYLQGKESAMTDGDAGLGAAAPVYAMSIGLCCVQ